MNVREQAAADLKFILSDTENGLASSFVFVASDGVEYPVSGIFGDIGYLIKPETGAAIQGRTIEAAYAMAALREQTERVPEKGWRFKTWKLDGTEYELFVVRYEGDQTVGIGRVKLAVNLK
ncbi:MAG: hypothetical protein LBJ31_04355 [Treponema sp.]|jgi:hypothetical protein|nr:hypothetical protein [Treponema sp.]